MTDLKGLLVQRLADALRAERPHSVRWAIAYDQWAADVVAVAVVLSENGYRLPEAQFDTLEFVRACHAEKDA